MSIIVQKYGGSSLSDIEKISRIADKIISRKVEGHDIVVVVSAMGKTTNNLIETAKQITDAPDKREMDMLLSAGERITMSLLCIKLKDMGFDSVSLTGSQAGIITNDNHNDARVIEVRPFRVEDEIRNGKIVVVGGFQGVSYKRDITTLGRGGSDTSAVALAAALDAEFCEIYSDVDGIYSADPNVVENAHHLPEISYQQMQEMSMAGAKVLNSQAVEFAKNSSIAIYARSSFGSSKETVVRKMSDVKIASINAVVYEKNILQVIIQNSDVENKIVAVLDYLHNNKISIKELNILADNDEIEPRATFLIPNSSVYNWGKIEDSLKTICGNSISFNENLSAVSAIGEGINQDNSIISDTIKLLKKHKIKFFGLTTTSFRLSLLVEKTKLEKTIKILHSHFIT